MCKFNFLLNFSRDIVGRRQCSDLPFIKLLMTYWLGTGQYAHLRFINLFMRHWMGVCNVYIYPHNILIGRRQCAHLPFINLALRQWLDVDNASVCFFQFHKKGCFLNCFTSSFGHHIIAGTWVAQDVSPACHRCYSRSILGVDMRQGIGRPPKVSVFFHVLRFL